MLAVLAYHKIGDPPRGAWQPWFYVPPALLEEQLAALRDDGWRFVGLASALRVFSEPDALPEKSVLVTFDDGYLSVLERALPVLAELQAPGVMFVPVGFVGELAVFDAGASEPLEPLCGWDELRELDASGIAVQSHGYRHRRLSEIEPSAVEVELAWSKQVLEEKLGKAIETYAYPYGDPGDAALIVPALKRCGYRAAFVYGGGSVRLPFANPFQIARIAVGSNTDLTAALDRR